MGDARRHFQWVPVIAPAMTGVACKPPYMGNRGISSKAKQRSNSYERQRRQHEAATIRHAVEQERLAQRHADGALSELKDRWGTRADALERRGHLERTISRLQREQDVLRGERDELVVQLRQAGESWNSLASRTGLSRQALSQCLARDEKPPR